MTGASGGLRQLDTFKTRIREQTCRTRGLSLTQIVEELARYLIGWRRYFGFCQTPRVLTNLEAWPRGRSARIFGACGGMGTTPSKNCAAMAYRSSGQRLPPVHRPDTG